MSNGNEKLIQDSKKWIVCIKGYGLKVNIGKGVYMKTCLEETYNNNEPTELDNRYLNAVDSSRIWNKILVRINDPIIEIGYKLDGANGENEAMCYVTNISHPSSRGNYNKLEFSLPYYID